MRLCGLICIVASLAACRSGGGTKTATNIGTLPTGAPTTASVVLGSPTPSGATTFTLEEGFEHDVCGIGISVKFIPPTATSSHASEAVLMGGPISNVDDQVQDHTGDQPLPSNAAEAKTGTTVTVYGKRFTVGSVDVANTRVGLTADC